MAILGGSNPEPICVQASPCCKGGLALETQLLPQPLAGLNCGRQLSPEKHSRVSKERSMQSLTAFPPRVTQISSKSKQACNKFALSNPPWKSLSQHSGGQTSCLREEGRRRLRWVTRHFFTVSFLCSVFKAACHRHVLGGRTP